MFGDDGASGGLSGDEVRELARVFCGAVEATQVLADVGLSRESQPSWGTPDAEGFWLEVSRLLENGKVPDGRVRLFDVACRRYPANRVFAAGSSRPVGVIRMRPSVELLPGLPARFVPREMDVAALRGLLLSPAGGAVVHDPGIRAAFPDGIVWVEVNSEPDITAVVSAVLAAFGDAAPVFDMAEGSERLRCLLAGAACLVVLDNVWHVDVLRALPLSGRARLLVTTRLRDALFTDSTVHEVGVVDTDMARRLLAAYAGCPAVLPADADVVLACCGGLALALALAGGMVGEGRPWGNVAERLRRAELGWLAGRFADYPHPNLLAALDATVAALPADAAERFRELAVFDGRGPVLARAVEAATAIGDPFDRACVLGDLAPHVPAALLARAVEAAAIGDPSDQAKVLGSLAPHLPAALLARAVEAAAAIDTPFSRASVLGDLAEHMPADERGPVLAQMVETEPNKMGVTCAPASGGIHGRDYSIFKTPALASEIRLLMKLGRYGPIT